ncbi:23S rRNA (uracil(1939)-C(5))-methyltransferase RlmD [Paenibacillus sp. 481]|uniref:23S rRNA (uracil(1939)-C(5))-methyltransferase RlmD n=1 Tax=Paenibacillus sp. 481 TaxID=2835869 RepID=UPI001E537B97|nr:23S rRNA (uracil(1939)-C(5))-methyltransferase RlmD [Paenibacillus sp. 481]UHA74712.1 23S rRNA (uracil(1939)-C(5))-methyltransferase RlmD [Paenibacillus sp. 481]
MSKQSHKRSDTRGKKGSVGHKKLAEKVNVNRNTSGNGNGVKGPDRSTAKAHTAPVDKNDVVVVDIIGLTHEGEGVGRVEGFTLFVNGALPGEKVRVLVLKVKKQYGYAKVVERLAASPHRIEAECEIYDQCGGCQMQHLSYAEQLVWKRQHVVDVMERIGKFKTNNAEMGLSEGDSQEEAVVILPTLGMEDPWRYRNKAQVPIGMNEREGGLIGGFYARNSHRIIDTDTCLIQHEANDEVVLQVKQIARELGIQPYHEETHHGLLRHVVVKYGFHTGERMIVLVTNGDNIPRRNELVRALAEKVPNVKSICQNVNTKRTNVIFGDLTRVLWGDEHITDYIGDVKFAISARSFYQVNPVQTEVLYGKTVEYAGLTGNETVIDAYCGIGTISLFLARKAKRVLGVEIVEEAIADARRNAELNGMTNAEFEVGPAEVVIPGWKARGLAPDVIVVDPPRKGCDNALLDTMLEMRPERIVYVSCNASTLARDLRVLADGGYTVKEVQPVDMFPHTVHVESVAVLVRGNL